MPLIVEILSFRSIRRFRRACPGRSDNWQLPNGLSKETSLSPKTLFAGQSPANRVLGERECTGLITVARQLSSRPGQARRKCFFVSNANLKRPTDSADEANKEADDGCLNARPDRLAEDARWTCVGSCVSSRRRPTDHLRKCIIRYRRSARGNRRFPIHRNAEE